MSRQLKWSILVLLGAVLIVAVMIMLRPQPEEQQIDESAPLVQVASYELSESAIDVLASGTVQPREEVSLGAEVSGRVVYVNPRFSEGSMVGAGTLLFRIDPADYRNLVRSAKADVAAQEVAVLQAQEEVAIAEDELRRFSQRETSRSAFSRSIDANDYSARILPPEELQQDAVEDTAQASSPNSLATREPQLRSAEAARDRAAAQLADAELALSRTEVKAPFTGLVRSEDAAIGALVQPGQALGSVVAIDAYEVRVSLTEAEAALIPGLFSSRSQRIPAEIELGYGTQTYHWSAYVDRADAILDAETRTIDVFLRVPNPLRGGRLVAGEDGGTSAPPPLLLGSFVQASISGSSQSPHAAIPAEALRPGNEVWIVSDGKLRIVPVRVIQQGDTIAHVAAEELAERGFVVTSALRTPVDGMAVRTPDASVDAGNE